MARTRTILTALLAIAAVVASFSIAPAAAIAQVAHPAVATKKVVIGFRYGHCSTAHPKDEYGCPDVLTSNIRTPTTLTIHTKKSLGLLFHLQRQYCSVLTPTFAGNWEYSAGLKLTKKKISGTYKFLKYDDENRGGYGDYGAVFTFSGTFVSSKEIKLTIKGHVTQTYDGSMDCAGVSFTETHILKVVDF